MVVVVVVVVAAVWSCRVRARPKTHQKNTFGRAPAVREPVLHQDLRGPTRPFLNEILHIILLGSFRGFGGKMLLFALFSIFFRNLASQQ